MKNGQLTSSMFDFPFPWDLLEAHAPPTPATPGVGRGSVATARDRRLIPPFFSLPYLLRKMNFMLRACFGCLLDTVGQIYKFENL